MKTHIIELTAHTTNDCYKISQLIKSSKLKSTKCVLKNTNEIVDVKIEICGTYNVYKLNDKELYPWEISKILFEFEIEHHIIQKDVYTFDDLEPIGTYDLREVVPIGNYMCKLINLETMEISHNILNVNKNICTCGGSFLFDMKKYSILELIKLEQ